MTTRNKLIEILSKNRDGHISGQELSLQLDISRTAVWKHMKELEKDGYGIEAVPRKGYRITDFPDKLSANTVQWGLKTNKIGRRVIHKKEVLSTQIIGHQLAAEGAPEGTVVIADEQTAGKGRMNRKWHSAKGEGIWMSIVLRPGIMPHIAPQITLMTATVLANAIQEVTGLNPQIKWPNDIMINGRKTAGILTEMQAEQDQVQYIVLGIGMNVNQLETAMPAELHKKATSLRQETGQLWNLNTLIQTILSNFESAYDHFLQYGFSDTKQKWESLAYKMGEIVTINTPGRQWKAELVGLAANGAVQVRTADNKVETLYSAEIQW
ncbi:biotin--[acetyl-CoA-carboxylase] ligase [Sediminibacillus massiliensis]|uniref:biotin--[acetyl-CoA-carboxylase] ligase n=1 Tax=Sediminibacillus massiliensis TaxID=1926277 RepID=UPI003183EFEC